MLRGGARRGAAQARRCASCRCRWAAIPPTSSRPRARGRWPSASTRRCRSCASASSASWPARTCRAPRARTRSSRRCGPVFRDIPASAMREELIGLVADRTELAPALVASWLAQGARPRSAQAGASGGNGASQRPPALPQPALDAAGRAERAFLAQCLASPVAGRAALAEMDLDGRVLERPDAPRGGARARRSWPAAARRCPTTTTSWRRSSPRSRCSRAACATPRRRSRASA